LVITRGRDAWKAYGRSGAKFGGRAVCSNALSVGKSILEARLLEPIKRDLLSPEILAELRRRVAQRLASRPPVALDTRALPRYVSR
jgi:hypothetical protein